MAESKQSHATENTELLRRISTGVAAILWILLTHVFVWPIASAISGYSNDPVLSYSVMVWAVPIAAAVAFLACRLVFPVTYPSPEQP